MATDLIIGTNSDILWRNVEYLEIITRNGKELKKVHVDLKDLFKNKKNNCNALNMPDENIDFARIINEKIEKVLSFGYIKPPGFLNYYIQELDNQMLFLATRTTVEDFIRIITCLNLASINEKIYLACHTNEFKYILEYLKRYFKFLTNANIERSGIFISNKGNPITASNLYNSKIENLHTKKIIDTVFSWKNC